MKNLHLSSLLCGLLAFCGMARASDRIVLTDGSVIVGKLLSADAGKLRMETSFAGTIDIVQAQVQSFSTDEAVNVSLASGSVVLGRVEPSEGGIKVIAADGQMASTTDKVAAIWRQGADSPEVKKMKLEADARRRKWAFEASLAMAGRSGVEQKFGAKLGFKGTLASAQDKLIFDAEAEKARDNGVDTANRQYGSIDYSAFFDPVNGWYVRTAIEKDTIKQLDLRSSTAVGLARKLIKNTREDLEARLGVNYLYENYSDNTKFDSPGLDVAILHTYSFANSTLTNAISYSPAFKNFSNYRLHHESAYEIPLGATQWKLKVGLANDYQSIPPAGTKRLDTTYFTSLLLNL